MRNHVWRPLFVVIGIVALLLGVRSFLVPDDFGIGERGYMYGFHRQWNEAEWKAQPVKYRAPDAAADCGGCHEQAGTLVASPHALVPCQNCHGPALEHPENPRALAIDRERTLCLRCHAALPYPESGRGIVPGIDPEEHNPGIRCVECHNPHAPSLEEVQP